MSCKSINSALERCVTDLSGRYRSTMQKVDSVQNHPLLCAALFQLELPRKRKVGDKSIGDLEKEGVIFLHGEGPNQRVTAPFLLLRYAMTERRDPPRLLRTLSAFLDPSANEGETLRTLKLKYEAFEGLRNEVNLGDLYPCLLYTSPSPRDQRGSRMPSSA